jgi:hypothetical protein
MCTQQVYDPDEPLVRKSLQKSTAFDPTEKPDSAMLGATVRDLSLQLANSDNNNNNNTSSNLLGNGDSNRVQPKVSTVLDAVVEVGKPSARYWGALYGLRYVQHVALLPKLQALTSCMLLCLNDQCVVLVSHDNILGLVMLTRFLPEYFFNLFTCHRLLLYVNEAEARADEQLTDITAVGNRPNTLQFLLDQVIAYTYQVSLKSCEAVLVQAV